MKLSREEKYILDALGSGKMKLSSPSKEEIRAIKTAANNTLWAKEAESRIEAYDAGKMKADSVDNVLERIKGGSCQNSR